MYNSGTEMPQKYAYQVPSHHTHQHAYVIGGLAEAPQLPARNKRYGDSPLPPSYVSAHTVALLALSMLLCLFGCSITVALSYKWHAETSRQIERLAVSVQEVKYDLSTLTDVVRDELVAKRVNDDGAWHRARTAEKPDGDDYEELDEGWEADRFMNKNLFDNNWPGDEHKTAAAAAAAHGANDTTSDSNADRRRRGADVGGSPSAVIAANKLNGSNNGKSNGAAELLEDKNDENTVKTHGQRKPRKMALKKKPPADPEDENSYEDFKEASDTAAAAHFTSDSLKYNAKINTNYHGNGRLNHPNGDFRDWTQLVWDTNLNNDNHFMMKNGRVEVTKPGLYFVYAQVYYSDQHDINGYYVMKNDEKVLGCTTARHSNSCYTGGLVYLKMKDILSVKGVDSERFIILDPVRSFFGLFKVSKDIKR